MLPLLSLHALAAQRGDGLRPELKTLFERRARLATGLAATIEPVEEESLKWKRFLLVHLLVQKCTNMR
jgi:hypothetical protein